MTLLRGRTLTQARAALAGLSRRLLLLTPSELPDLSLARGLAGVALAHASLHAVFPAAGHLARAERRLEQCLTRLEREAVEPWLYEGAAGVAWVVAHLLGDEGADLCAPIDRALTDVLDQTPWSEPFDLIKGVVGVGVYALERGAGRSAKGLIPRVVARLAEMARRHETGVAWWSNPMWLPARARRTHNPDWNTGVAHGAAGVIALLGKVLRAGVDVATAAVARELLGEAVAWLLSQELAEGAVGCFPWAVAPSIAREPARLAWCAGDLGIAAALWIAARGAREPDWERAAQRVALRAAQRTEANAGVVDVGLCHGAAGVAHLFHRLYRQTGDARLADASRAWFGRVLAMREEGRGIAGFRAYDPDARGKLRWRNTAGFLTGAAGVALALVAATGGDAGWDRALLVS